MSLSNESVPNQDSSHSDVILNGGEAGVRDRTGAENSDEVNGNAHAARGVLDPIECIATLRASLGPSEGYRPPQDDIASS